MTFGKAIEILKHGGVVQRVAWNGCWLVYVEGTTRKLMVDSPYGRALALTKQAESHVTIHEHIDYYDGEGGMHPGWTPSQADMLASDWHLVEPT